MYFDTHAHYDDAMFDPDRAELLRLLPMEGVSFVLNPGCTLESSKTAVALAEGHDYIYAAVGIHPEEASSWGSGSLDELRELCGHERVRAVGEIGLDYHYEDMAPKKLQIEIFDAQMELARELDLPVIVHDRDAHGDSLDMARRHRGVRGVFHCFSGSADMARELLKMGWYLGFDGPVTYKNNRRAAEVLAVTPVERILLETDSPYLSPVPNRGRRNDSRSLMYICAAVAGMKNMDGEELARRTLSNAREFYGV